MIRKIEAGLLAIILLWVTLTMVYSCNTYKKQLQKFQSFGLQHNDELAKICSTVFTVKDSIGQTKVDSTHKANNVNYQGTIDSLQKATDKLKQTMAFDTAKNNPCASVAKAYQFQVDQLSDQLAFFKMKYRPCKPDTVYKTKEIFRRDLALETTLTNVSKRLSDSLIIVKQDLKNSKSSASDRLKIIFILSAIIGAAVVLGILKLVGKL